MSELPASWMLTEIASLFATLEDGRTLQQGWSPQCESVPSETDDDWGVLKTTAIQPASFVPAHNKRLPSGLVPRPQIEVRAGDILITCAGPRARCGISCLVRSTRPRLMMSGKMYRFRTPEQAVLPSYVEHYLQSAEARLVIDAMKTGGSDSGLNLTHDRFRRLPIPLAPRAEQERIVAAIEERFSRLDAGVSALERIRKNLKRLRAAALNALLTDDDGQDWPTVTMGAVLAAGRYGTSTKCSYDGKGLPVLRIPNVQSGRIDLRDMKRAIDRRVDLTGSLAEEGSVLIIRTNGSRSLIGRAAIVPSHDEQLAYASYLIQLQFDRAKADSHYMVLALSAPRMRQRIEFLAATTAGQYNISLAKLRSLEIPLPPIEHQLRQSTETDHRLGTIAALESTLAHAVHRQRQLRSSILASAFCGRLVHQDPTDEPASVLLNRTASERTSSNGDKPTLVRTGRSNVTL
jgi:type I restriction enzyme, S subunit